MSHARESRYNTSVCYLDSLCLLFVLLVLGVLVFRALQGFDLVWTPDLDLLSHLWIPECPRYLQHLLALGPPHTLT